jgi:hypothetical protein
MLKFSKANAKIQALAHLGAVYSFDLPAGKCCPFADKCKSEVVIVGGRRKIQDGPNCQFRCFSASQEVLFTNVYNSRKHNYEEVSKLSSAVEMAKAIEVTLPSDAGVVRIHVAGDFYNLQYFRAWAIVAKHHPKVVFYTYTKSVRYWVKDKESLPSNFILTASLGGLDDDLISQHNLRSVKVVYSIEEAKLMGLPIDHTDEYAALPQNKGTNFALLLHGTQPAGSGAAAALKVLKKNNVKFSYPR